VIRVIDDAGNMNENAGKYKGQTRFHCRKEVVEDLRRQNLFVKIEPFPIT